MINKKLNLNFASTILRGKYFAIGSRDRLKATLVNLLLLLAIMIMLIDVYGSIVHHYYIMSIIEGLSALIFIILYFLFYNFISLQSTINVTVSVIAFLFIISLTIPGDNPKFALFWLATLPIYIFFFFGTNLGIKLSIVVILTLVLTTINTIFGWIEPLYNTDFLVRITISYGAISYLVYILERERLGFENKLIESVKEKELLYKELNHRVKNNLLMILSLVKLQISRTVSEETKNELLVTKNRIDSISTLYECLHIQYQECDIDTYTYFVTLIDNIKPLTSKNIKVTLDIQYNLSQEQLLYIGLILNELSTNAFKYAFIDEGELSIKLKKQNNTITMTVEDNGIGFIKKSNNSLGFVIVETLVKEQLDGKLDINSNNGTQIIIQWDEHA